MPNVSYLTLLLDASEVLEEVEVEVGATELAVGYRSESIFYLLLCNVVDMFVFDFAEFVRGNLSVGSFCTCFKDGFGAEEGANVVGTVYTSGKRHCV